MHVISPLGLIIMHDRWLSKQARELTNKADQQGFVFSIIHHLLKIQWEAVSRATSVCNLSGQVTPVQVLFLAAEFHFKIGCNQMDREQKTKQVTYIRA
jgi:hypothetical protein